MVAPLRIGPEATMARIAKMLDEHDQPPPPPTSHPTASETSAHGHHRPPDRH